MKTSPETLISELVHLNEMDMLKVLEAIKFHIKEKSDYPDLLTALVDKSELDDLNHSLSILQDDNEELQVKADSAEARYNSLSMAIKNLIV